VRSRRWRPGVEFTDYEDEYDFDPMEWLDYGFVQLRHCPVLSIERAKLYSPVKSVILDMLPWVRLNRTTGSVQMYPKGSMQYGPFAMGVMPWRNFGYRYPGGLEFDYTTGWESAEFVPDDLRDVIGKLACIQALDTIGDGILAGFSSMSVSLDGLSESFSSTQSATSGYFGPRQQSFKADIKQWLERNRYKYGAPPMSFVGV
jgi:hypothetical protein